MSAVILRFLAAALVYFVVALLLGLAGLAGLSVPTPVHVHLALVGFVCGVIIATMYQQVPTLTGAELHSKRAASASFWLFNSGLVVFSLSYPHHRLVAAAGALLLLVCFYLFTYNILATIAERRGENYAFKFYSAASVLLSLGATLGFLILLNPALYGYRPSHVHLSLVGGVTLIIFGAMSWMLPMLVVKDIYNRRWVDYVFYLTLISAAGMVLGFGLSEALLLLSGAVLLSAAALFTYDMVKSYTAPTRMSFKPEPVESRFFLAALGYLLLVLLLGLVQAAFPEAGLSSVHAHLAALGFVGQTVIGGLYHVIPTLAWARILPRERERAPSSFKELFSAERSRWIFYAYNAGVVLLALGMYLSQSAVSMVGGLLLLLSASAFSLEMLGIIRRAGVLP
ncbi:MAG: cbb3-type cytochrome c oxidase subunit I [Euryarchaeota archaeon]|nr:cbb3-type cytochrome c oxidase subunit I [Euryarchaeota archaeon]